MKVTCLEGFFGGFWNRMVYKCRFTILLVFTIWAAFAVTFAMNIKTQSKEDSELQEDNYILKTKREIDRVFPPLITEVIND